MTAFERIRDVHVPLWLARFEEKSADYNDTGGLPFEPHTMLGIRGQYADIWRKVWKLKKALWDGEKLVGEQPIEIIDDLMSHLMMTRDLITKEIPLSDTVQATLWTEREQFRCGQVCAPRSHTFVGKCRYRLADSDA